MSDKSFNKQAAVLVEGAVDLIKQVLVKHSAAVLEEMHDQIVARNARISALEAELNTIHALAMNPQDTAPREGDKYTVALLRQLLATNTVNALEPQSGKDDG